MNINIFFISIFAALAMIYIFFQPTEYKEEYYKEIPLFKINDFTLYELNTKELFTLMKGSEAVRYKERYEVSAINYTDSSKNYIANMIANEGVYKDSIVTLNGDVVYSREDGLIFETQSLLYDKVKTTAYVEGDFVAHQAQNRVTGRMLHYNNTRNFASAKKITALYNLEEGNE